MSRTNCINLKWGNCIVKERDWAPSTWVHGSYQVKSLKSKLRSWCGNTDVRPWCGQNYLPDKNNESLSDIVFEVLLTQN